MGLKETYGPRFKAALQDIQEALARHDVEVTPPLKASEVPDYIRQIQIGESEPELGEPIMKPGSSFIDHTIWQNADDFEHIVVTDEKAPAGVQTADLSYDGKMGVVAWGIKETKTYYISSQREGMKVQISGLPVAVEEFIV